MDISQTEKLIGYSFNDKKILKKALTHASYHASGQDRSYEKLEFFGDSFLNFVIAKYIFKNQQKLSVGDMTKLRAKIVCTENLKQATMRLGLQTQILTAGARGLENGKKLYADVFESIVGGIYIDGGEEESERFVLRTLQKEIGETLNSTALIDYKTTLQEYVQKHKLGNIVYKTCGVVGSDHKPHFEIALIIAEEEVSRGSGESKKRASQLCAKMALEKFQTKEGEKK